MYESFPFFPDPKRRHEVLYCLVSELVESGTVHDHLASTRRPWSQRRAVQEIVALLKLLDRLHGAGALHRDITPMNVFLCENRHLKLGDFGIAKHVLAGRAATATAFNPSFVSNRMALGVQRYWLASDDVYQMGQLLGMLLRGDPHTLIGQVPQPPEQSRHVAVATATRSETLMPITCTDSYSNGKASVLA